MPAVWEQADYDAAYQRWHPGFGIRQASYRRDLFGPNGSGDAWIERAQQWGIKLAGAVNPASNVLVVGCGFGWIIEQIRDGFGHQRVWGTDLSNWIHAEKATHARADVAPLIAQVDIAGGPAAVNAFKALGFGQQGKFDWVVTEHVVEGIAVADLQGFLDDCEAILRPQGDVAHIIDVEHTNTRNYPDWQDPHDRNLDVRWRSLADWVAERPSHYWLAENSQSPAWQLGGGV